MLILRIILRIWLSNILLSISGVVTGITENNSRCQKGHFKSSPGECFPCIDGCFRCKNNETCEVCETKYTRTDIGTCQLCPKNCNICDRNECTACDNGYFLQNKSCVSCPNTCQKCTSHEGCTECMTGSWGPRCDKTCPYDCFMDICNIATGNCDACEDGHYGINCSKCPDYCLNNSCNMSGYCTVGCLEGFYGENCTQMCRNTCKYCSTESNCYQCIDGYYGQGCPFDCSTCKDSLCIMSACTYGCKTGFYMDGIECKRCSTNCKACNSNDMCSQCQDGYYGPVCEFNCSHCQHSACNKLSCIFGCKSGFYSDRIDCKHCRKNCKACYSSDQCSQCQDGYYGPVCQFDCSKCQYSKCNELSCVYGCKTRFYLDGNECKQCRPNCTACKYKNRCSECEDGKYGRLCQNDCDKLKCLACKGNESNCTKCHAGYKLDGNKCCSLNCQTCDDYGQCNNCTDGYYGIKCTKSCQNKCKSCLNKHECKECAQGRFDSRFDIEAGQCYCSTSQCKENNTDGTCTKCKRSRDWYTYKSGCCSCSKNCKDTKCDIDGSCIEGCTKGTWGRHCDKKCPNKHCLSCKNGFCEECESGYFGDECQYECSSNCYKTTEGQVCNVKSGHCLHGCINGTWGNSCDNTCDERCLHGLCEHASGHCLKCRGKSGSACLHDDQAVLPEGSDSIFVPLVITVSIIVVLAIIVFGAFLVRHYKSRISVREKSVRMNDAVYAVPDKRKYK